MTERFLLDTNVISEMRRSRPDPDVLRFVSSDPRNLHLSDATIAEITVGIRAQPQEALRHVIEQWLMEIVLVQFAGRILPASSDVLGTTFEIMHATRRLGLTLSIPDALIAGTASFHDMIAVSRDTHPFRHARVPVLDPWKALFYAPGRDGVGIDLATRKLPDGWRV